METKDGGMGIRDLWDLYREINISNYRDMMNFQTKDSLYAKTTQQRMKDVKEEFNIEETKKNKIKKELYEKYWGVRVIRLMERDKVRIEKNERPNIEYKESTTFEEIREKVLIRNVTEKKWNDMENLGIDINKAIVKKKLDKRENIIKNNFGRKISKREWKK